MGRRKIEMKMVENSNTRQVTFSKRRTGIFKKANELAVLCAVQIAIIVFSPGGKPFSFGHPNVESVIQRFRKDNNLLQEDQNNEERVIVGDSSSSSNTDHNNNNNNNNNSNNNNNNSDSMDVLNRRLVDALKRLKAEEKKREALERKIKAKAKAEGGGHHHQSIFRKPIHELGLPRLEELKASFEELHKKLKNKIDEKEATDSLLLLSKHPR